MSNTPRITFLALAVIAGAAAVLPAQAPDPLRDGDWRELLRQSQADTDPANRRSLYLSAWKAAYDWAVYDLERPKSGTKRADGMLGMQTIREAGPPPGLDISAQFDAFEKLQAESPPHLLSSKNQKNRGLWLWEGSIGPVVFEMVQNGGFVSVKTFIRGRDGKLTHIPGALPVEGRLVFDDARRRWVLNLEISHSKTLKQRGTLEFKGNDTETLVGELVYVSNNPNFGPGREQISLKRTYLGE